MNITQNHFDTGARNNLSKAVIQATPFTKNGGLAMYLLPRLCLHQQPPPFPATLAFGTLN